MITEPGLQLNKKLIGGVSNYNKLYNGLYYSETMAANFSMGTMTLGGIENSESEILSEQENTLSQDENNNF